MGDYRGWSRPATMTFPSGDVPRSITRLPIVPDNCIRSGRGSADGEGSFGPGGARDISRSAPPAGLVTGTLLGVDITDLVGHFVQP